MENREQQPKKKIYKRWWFWLIIVFVIIVVISSGGEKTPNPTLEKSITGDQESTSNKENETKDIQIINVGNKITEKNSVWWKFAWIATLKNNTQKSQTVYVSLNWLDSDGFVVTSNTIASECVLPAGEETKCKGYELIDTSVAVNVESIEAEIKDSIF